MTSLSHCTFLLGNHRDFQNFVACSLEDRSHNLGHHKFGALLVAGEEEGALGPLDLQDWPCFFSHSAEIANKNIVGSAEIPDSPGLEQDVSTTSG